MKKFTRIFVALVIVEIILIISTIYVGVHKSYDCKILGIINSECIDVSGHHGVAPYNYRVKCDISIYNVSHTAKGSCSSHHKDCSDCIIEFIVNNTYICWYIGGIYKLNDNMDFFSPGLIVLTLLDFILGMILIRVGILLTYNY